MTRRLALVRHSTPVIAPEVPACEWKLSDEGRARCKIVAEELRDLSANRIFTSDEPKAIGTAEEIGRLLYISVEIVNGVHEHLRARLPFYEAAEWRRLIEALFANPDSLVLGHETTNQARARFDCAIETLVNSTSDDDLIVVTHGTVMSLYLSAVLGEDPYSIWESLEMPDVRIVDLDSTV